LRDRLRSASFRRLSFLMVRFILTR
jgi:hypothetical protein